MSKRIERISVVVYLLSAFFFLVDFVKAQDRPELRYKEGELIVRFATREDKVLHTESEMNIILSTINGGTISRKNRIIPDLCLVKLPENKIVKDMLQTFNLTNGILYAEPNYKLKAFDTTPNDPCYVEQWGLNNTGQTGADIDAPEAWDIRTNADPNIIVAVIDSGVDYEHDDLAENMWINELEYNGTAGIDDDGNGYIDDIYGYDFCTWENKQRDSIPEDDNGHGTHIAGIIGAVGNNNKYVSGVCWDVKLMTVKSFLTRLDSCDKVKWSSSKFILF